MPVLWKGRGTTSPSRPHLAQNGSPFLLRDVTLVNIVSANSIKAYRRSVAVGLRGVVERPERQEAWVFGGWEEQM